MERQAVMDTIRKLSNMTTSKGCTEGEAITAAGKIGELLKVYNLSMNEVFLCESKCIQLDIALDKKSRSPIDRCIVSLANFCDCRVWFEPGRAKNSKSAYHFFGLDTDTEMIKYLYAVVKGAMELETENFKRSPTYLGKGTYRRSLTVSFQKGMAGRLHERLKDMTKERKIEEGEKSPTIHLNNGTSTSMIVMKQDKVEQEFRQLGMNLRSVKTPDFHPHWDSYDAGKKAADKVGFNRPIQHTIAGLIQ